MDEDRIAGAAKRAKGTVKETVGRLVGNTRLEADGQADQVEGTLQNAFGRLKDTVRKA